MSGRVAYLDAAGSERVVGGCMQAENSRVDVHIRETADRRWRWHVERGIIISV